METPCSDSPLHQTETSRHKTFGRKLVLLMWKNMLLRKRHWLLTSFEILLPTLLFTLLLTIRIIPDSAFVPEYINETTTFSVATEESLREIVCRKYGVWIPPPLGPTCVVAEGDTLLPGQRKIFYGPPGNFTEGVAKHVAQSLHLPENVLEAVQTNEEMDVVVDRSYFETNDSWATFYVGLYFHDLDDPGPEPPDTLNYDLRLAKVWLTAYLYPFLQVPGPRNFTIISDAGSYNMDGFTLIQSLVDRYYISLLAEDDFDVAQYELQTEMYPYPPYVQDNAMSQFYGSSLPTFIVLSLVLLSPSLIKSVVYEKETGVRELMRLMGLESWLVWLGWFLHSFIIIIIVSSIMTLLMKLQLTPFDNGKGVLPPILTYSDPFLIWVILVVYGISSITFCFVIATFFNRPTLATTLGILLWLTSYFVPGTVLDSMYEDMTLTGKLLSCLIPNMAITDAFRVIAMFEGRTLGIQWTNLWETGNPRDQLTVGMILLMLLLDTFLFLLVTWYVDQVNPGIYGVPKRLYFPFQKSYWCGMNPSDAPEDAGAKAPSGDPQYFEKEPQGLVPGIIIRNLRKEFRTLGGKVKVAVENVSMTCYEGQCTVLLGHNGAGKTTTMSVLTGVYAPSGGRAQVGGWDISTHLKEAREEMGLCPQHNMLFADLTVLQHLMFFGRLKGMSKKAAKKEAKALMGRLHLLEKRDMYGNKLSGGMKRKLCLAISLIGGSKVVILDEPSSGLDPESRRWVWSMIQGERGRRTVLVTTHHMEEADVLGDRVAIMASGRVICAGSTLFLKNKFGDGYTLTVMVSEGANVNEVRDVVRDHLPKASLRSTQGGEITFKLPPTTSHFAPLLDALTTRKEELGVHHLGLSLTSMEQVFLRVGEVTEGRTMPSSELNGSARNGSLHGSQSRITYDSIETLTRGGTNGHMNNHLENGDAFSSQRFLFNSQSNVEVRLMGWKLLQQQLRAFFTKRFIYSKRKWVLLLTQGLMPVLVTLMCLLVDASFNDETLQEPPLLLNLSMYEFSQSFVHADPDQQDLAQAYQNLFKDPYRVNYTDDIQDSLLQEADKDLFRYRENSVCSADFLDNGTVTAMRMLYQSVPYHTPGVSTSLITNALLHYATNSSSYSITTTNRPLPPDKTWRLENDNSSTSALLYAMIMPLALAFLSSSFVVFPLQERESKAKQIQVMTGAPVWALWLITFVWDLITYFISVIVIFAFFMLLDSKNYFTVGWAPGALLLVLVLYGWGSIPMAYVFSFPFQNTASGFAALALLNIVTGMIMTTAVWALDLSGQPKLEVASDVINWISSLIPTYAASMGFMHIVDTSVYNAQCDVFNDTIKDELCETLSLVLPYSPFMPCCPMCATVGNKTCFEERSYFLFDDPGIAPDLLTLVVNGVIFLVFLTLIEAQFGKIFRRVCTNMRTSSVAVTPTGLPEDDDVAAEAASVDDLMAGRTEQNAGLSDKTTLLVSDLSKRFSGSPSPAVNKISFRVVRGECLGLLGINGAGKTTTFRMLTGDEIPSAGDARISRSVVGNISLISGTNEFVQEIGYCPQFDAILGELTGVEMLTLLARLRGVSRFRMKHVINSLINLVDLTECAERPCSTYSGGNRRKLSTAMALVGSPPLVFLDEPTSGVDPASRRRVWQAISSAVQNGQSVVLTSHSMEECEALCSRIIIMSRGTLRCLGTTAHLKAKFGQGYSLQVKLRTRNQEWQQGQDSQVNEDKVAELKHLIKYHLRGSTLTDEHKEMLAFRVPPGVSWSRLFSVMEALKGGHDPPAPSADLANGAATSSSPESPGASAVPKNSLVEDYAASDTSLEQVFISFAREAMALSSASGFQIPKAIITKL